MEQRFRVVKRSIDARQKQLKVHLTVVSKRWILQTNSFAVLR